MYCPWYVHNVHVHMYMYACVWVCYSHDSPCTHVHELLYHPPSYHHYRVLSSPPSPSPFLLVELSLAKWWQGNIWISLTSLVWVYVVLSGSSWTTSPSLERARRGRGWCSTSHRDTTTVTPAPCLPVVSQLSFFSMCSNVHTQCHIVLCMYTYTCT